MTPTSKVAVVTGAARGIGRRAAEVLADAGYDLALTDVRDCAETAAAVGEPGARRRGRSRRRIGGGRRGGARPAGGRAIRPRRRPGQQCRDLAMDSADQATGGYVDSDVVERTPMARFAAPDDVAAAIAFLADAESSGFVNGVTLPVDGGWTADLSWNALRLRKR
jgi:NAD(P)-dependent dehydrogenase (short-subunit alcohol dehydrogenase family)